MLLPSAGTVDEWHCHVRLTMFFRIMPGLQHRFAVLIAAIAPDYTTAQDAPHIIGRSLSQGTGPVSRCP